MLWKLAAPALVIIAGNRWNARRYTCRNFCAHLRELLAKPCDVFLRPRYLVAYLCAPCS
jgi:hypothetical protein